MKTYIVKGKGDSPDCTVVRLNEPNHMTMAKAFINLYEDLKKNDKLEKVLSL